MNKWIELNLPYDYDSVPKFIAPDLSIKAKLKLGFNMNDIKNTELKFSYNEINKIYDQIYNIKEKVLLKYEQNSPKYQKEVDKIIDTKSKKIKTIYNLQFKKRQYNDWFNQQPEVIEANNKYNQEYIEYKKKHKKMSFVGLELNKPGILIEVEMDNKISQYLIGHVNPVAGVCNDCVKFDTNKAIVKRYKVIWSK